MPVTQEGRADPGARTWCSAAAWSRRGEAGRLHLCHCHPPPESNHCHAIRTHNRRRNANTRWVNRRRVPRVHGAPSICHLWVIICHLWVIRQPVLADLQAPRRPGRCGGDNSPSRHTADTGKTAQTSSFVGWVHTNAERRVTAVNSGISERQNTTASQAAEHPQVFGREHRGPTNLSIFGSSNLTKLCL